MRHAGRGYHDEQPDCSEPGKAVQQSERGFPRQPFGSVMWIACPFPAWAKRPTRPNFRRPAGTSDREDGTKNRRRQNDRVLALLVSSTRPVNGPLSVHNTRSAFGRVSRYAHWVVGTLILALLPLGLFTWVLGPDHPEHGAFLAMHQTLGPIDGARGTTAKKRFR